MQTVRNFLKALLMVCLCVAAPAGAELIQHLDASVAGSVVTDGSGKVTQWTDQSGAGNHATDDIGDVMYPSTIAFPGGPAGLDFGQTRNSLVLFTSAANDNWLNFDAGATGGFAVFVAFKPDSVEGSWNDVIGNSSVVADGFLMRYQGSNGNMQAALDGTINMGGDPVVAGDTIVYGFNYDAATGAYDFWDSKNDSSATGTRAAADFSRTQDFTLGTTHNGNRYMRGMVGEVMIFDSPLSQTDIDQLKEDLVYKWITPPEEKVSPSVPSPDSPDDGYVEVLLDGITLTWIPGKDSTGDDVYIGTDFNAVSTATPDNDPAGVYMGRQSEASFTLPHLDYGKTYYWRIDSINGGIYSSPVWSFDTIKYAYPIESEYITATASSSIEDVNVVNTINGSGLYDDNLHSTDTTAMWLSSSSAPGEAWMRYDFDKPYKLHQMLVWNYNGEALNTVYGLKEVTIEHSFDGVNWTQLGNYVSEFTQAPGTNDYAPNTVVDFNDLVVKHVRITAHSNWSGSFADLYGLSEVRFLYIPLWARELSPAEGSTDVDPAVELSWRAGREAGAHEVYLGSDPNNLPLAEVVTGSPYAADTTGQDLQLGQTYYWRIDEVNDAETPTTWQGDIWSFSTQEYLVVDDFESYNDIPAGEEGSNLIYLTWADGFDNPTVNGSAMGYTVPFEPTMETDIVHTEGIKSAPLQYNNATAAFSEVTRTLAPQNWTDHGIQTLSLWFFGDSTNTPGQLYVKINGVKVNYNGDSGNLGRPLWHRWNIDLASVGANLQSVTSLAVGVDSFGATGTLLLDDIRLYQSDPVDAEEIWLEAEAADSITPPMKIYNDLLASGGQYIGTDDGIGDENDNPPADGVAKYSFTVEGGVYKIVLRIRPDAGNSVWVRIPGATSYNPGTHSSGWIRFNGMEAGADWHWDEVHSTDHGDAVVKIMLPAGQHTLQIARREDGGLLDVILITSDVE